MPADPSRIADPALYRRLSEPMTAEAAAAAVDAFHVDLRAIREKHGIRDVAVVCIVSVKDGASEYEIGTVLNCGDTLRLPYLMRFGLNHAVSLADADLRELAGIEEATKRGKKKGGGEGG